MFDKVAISALTSGGDVTINFHRLTDAEINEMVPSGLRQQLNGGCVVELSNSLGQDDLGGKVTVSLKTDVNPKNGGAYRVDAEKDSWEEQESVFDEGYVSFETNGSGIYAVSGILLEPAKVTAAVVMLVFAMLLGAITVVAYRWH